LARRGAEELDLPQAVSNHSVAALRHLRDIDPLLRGERAALVGLLEDIHRLADKQPPRPEAQAEGEQPYLQGEERLPDAANNRMKHREAMRDGLKKGGGGKGSF